MRKVVPNVWLVAAVLVLAPVAAEAQDVNGGLDVPRGLKRIWDDLTPQERQAYLGELRGPVRSQPVATLGAPVFGSPAADECRNALAFVEPLTYTNANDTTAAVNDYEYGDSCTCSDLDLAMGLRQCLPSGPRPCCGAFVNSGVDSPDIAYRVKFTMDCNVRVTIDPTDPAPPPPAEAPDDPCNQAIPQGDNCPDDLALFVVQDCLSPISSCVGSSDGGEEGDPEQVSFSATVGTEYLIVVDGFGGLTNADQGPFNLSIEELVDPAIGATGCSLVPVGLGSFVIE